MAFELTTTAKLLSQQINIGQQIILEIDGIPLIFGAVTVTKLWKIGDEGIKIGDPGLKIGGIIEDANGRAFISLRGTTNQITQQLEIDKGGVGSIQKFNVVLVDKDQGVTQAFTPGTFVDDILSREANVYLNFQGGAHPEDSIRIFNGIVVGQEASPGRWKVTIDHPEFLKRQDLYEQINTNLDGAISAGATSLVVDSVSGFIAPADVQKSFLLIGEELIEYTTITAGTNTFSGLTRGALGTVAASHDDDAQATSFYTLAGQALDLALKLMLSNGDGSPFSTDNSATRFVKVTNALTVENGVLLDARIQDDLGLELGDLMTVAGATEGANNFIDAVIEQFQEIPEGTVVVLSGVSLVEEIDSSAVASFTSQFNVLPEGCSMKPSQVDVAQHLELQAFFATGLPDYLFFLKDTINAKEFITNEVYFPQGFYQVPRKGRASVNITQPPLVLSELVEFTDINVEKAARNTIKRQITKNFFNTIVYRFDVDTLTDKFLAGEVIVSERSFNRIDTGTRALKLEAKGLRDDAGTRNFIRSQSRRFSDRYQFAAESIKIEVNYKSGFNVEVADIVLFGSSVLQIPDINTGDRNFEPRLMEVVNKSMNIKTGDIKLELLDTGFGIDGRFGVVSPNSFINSGATTTSIPLKKSFTTGAFEIEREKWINLIGEEIRIRNEEYTFNETTRLLQFDPNNDTNLIIDPPLSLAPSEDFLVDLPDYDTVENEDQKKMKDIHVFIDPEAEIVSASSDTAFVVSLADINKFFVGSLVRVHNDDFSDNSTPGISDDDAEVVFVDTGTGDVTVDKSLGFTPIAGDIVDLIGFAIDEGLPYRFI